MLVQLFLLGQKSLWENELKTSRKLFGASLWPKYIYLLRISSFYVSSRIRFLLHLSNHIISLSSGQLKTDPGQIIFWQKTVLRNLVSCWLEYLSKDKKAQCKMCSIKSSQECLLTQKQPNWWQIIFWQKQDMFESVPSLIHFFLNGKRVSGHPKNDTETTKLVLNHILTQFCCPSTAVSI